MKLPEYDNRPSPGTPLYSDKSGDSSEWADIKFSFWALSAGIGLLAFVGLIIYGLFEFLGALLN